MISINKLYFDSPTSSDGMRYGTTHASGGHPIGNVHERPIVVWNMTRQCNLACRHCYSRSDYQAKTLEMSHEQAKNMIEDIARFRAPVLLFSGGEPLMREDLFDLAFYARELGLRIVLSSNGTLIDEKMVNRLKETGFSYIGISLDGIGATHDYFRNQNGAYEKTLQGIRLCRDAGLMVGLRFTVVKDNLAEVPAIFDLIHEERLPRACFYHLAYSGRGNDINSQDTSLAEKRTLLDLLIDRSCELRETGRECHVLTVGNHADGPYLYMRLLKEGNPQAEIAWELLKRNGGNSSGVGISCVSWDGTVYPDQFWRAKSLGNILERPLSGIWMDESSDFMYKLKRKKEYVKGRCATCRFLEVCGGNLRVRAEASCGDVWAPDPACYLTDEEIRAIS